MSATDVIGHLGVVHGSPAALTASTNRRAALEPKLEAVLSIIEPYPQSREDLLQRSGLTAAQFNEVLLRLELEGLVETTPGNMIHSSIEGSC